MLDASSPHPDGARWLPGTRLNIAAAALGSPRAPHGAPAIVWADEASPTAVHSVSFPELRQRAAHVAACVRARFRPGDALAIYMPMTVDAVVVYLGVVLAGGVVVSIADSFAAHEVRGCNRCYICCCCIACNAALFLDSCVMNTVP